MRLDPEATGGRLHVPVHLGEIAPRLLRCPAALATFAEVTVRRSSLGAAVPRDVAAGVRLGQIRPVPDGE